jgi:hypothetical protein
MDRLATVFYGVVFGFSGIPLSSTLREVLDQTMGIMSHHLCTNPRPMVVHEWINRGATKTRLIFLA